MVLVLLLNTGTTTGDVFETTLVGTYHIENLTKMKSLLVAFDIFEFFVGHFLIKDLLSIYV
jgi:hypothetical protein